MQRKTKTVRLTYRELELYVTVMLTWLENTAIDPATIEVEGYSQEEVVELVNKVKRLKRI